MRLTNEEIVELFKTGSTYTRIADLSGISRQRVHQIIKKKYPEYKKSKPNKVKCAMCGRTFTKTYNNVNNKICKNCKQYNKHIVAIEDRRLRRFEIKKNCIGCRVSFKIKPHKARNRCNNCYRKYLWENFDTMKEYHKSYYLKTERG